MVSAPNDSPEPAGGTPPFEEGSGASLAAASVRRAPRSPGRAIQSTWPLAVIGVLSLLANTARPTPAGPGRTQSEPASAAAQPLAPLVDKHPVQWWTVFKLNAATFATTDADARRGCPFGGAPRTYKVFSQRYAVASSQAPELADGQGLAGVGPDDPLGATFDEIYRGTFHYVVWNDQFYDAPKIIHCTKECGAPWGHSKGILAWNEAGEGIVIQVTTPSWPASGSVAVPRVGDGNTLGCIQDNNVLVSQDFFALRLTKDDVVEVLKALGNASVVTDPLNTQLINRGGPADVDALAAALGVVSNSVTPTKTVLSSGVQLISKPSKLHVPPWQLVSAELGGVPLRVASWWTTPAIPTAKAGPPPCWSPALAAPGAVEIAEAGQWDGKTIGLRGGPGSNANHAKIGVSTDSAHSYAIFGDMNQQGALSGACGSSQNGRGGLFFVVDSQPLAKSIGTLLASGATHVS